jgi:zinc transport system substrate-binding protein
MDRRTTLRLAPLAVAVTALMGLAGLAGCGGDDDTGSGRGKVGVVANFFPIAEAAEQVGGNRVEVTNLTPAGTEPHDLELTPDQVADVEDAQVVFYMGEGFQPAVADAAEHNDGAVDITKAVHLEEGAAKAIAAQEGEGGSDVDPHFWLDPQLMAKAVDRIEHALTKASPKNAATFKANATAYKAKLTALDGEFSRGLASCKRDEIVTSHAAFYYLAKHYGLTQLPITGLSPEAEPDPARLADLADKIKADGITTVFYEELVSPAVAETLAREADVQAAVLNPIEGLSKDEVDKGADYLSVMRENLTALRKALGCT